MVGGDPLVSGVHLIAGDVYSFSILVDPQQNRYQVEVANLDFISSSTPGLETFQSPWLDFLRQDGEVAGTLNFSGRVRTIGNTLNFSMDQLSIIPEPSIMGLLFLAVVFLSVRRFRNRR